jgi:hypothetical protein
VHLPDIVPHICHHIAVGQQRQLGFIQASTASTAVENVGRAPSLSVVVRGDDDIVSGEAVI